MTIAKKLVAGVGILSFLNHRDTPLCPKKVIALWESVRWGFSSDYDPQKVLEALNNSQQVFYVLHKQKLVGLIRALSDGVFNAFVMDLSVDPEYQNIGIASKLLEILKQRNKGLIIWFDVTESAGDFFKKRGFKQRPHMQVFATKIQ